MGILLHRYTGVNDPTFGLALPDRTISVQLDLEGAPSFRVVTEQAAAAVEGARPAQRPQVVLALDGETDDEPPTDFRLQLTRENGSIHAELDYDAELTVRPPPGACSELPDDPRRRASEPDALAGQLPLLTGVEQQVLLGVERHRLRVSVRVRRPPRRSAGSRTPDAVAVECDGVQLTYAELERRADRLASFLRGLGVGPDVLVGICVERSVEMVVGVLGILEPGGRTCRSILRTRSERQAFMLEDAAAPMVLTQERLLEQRAASADARSSASTATGLRSPSCRDGAPEATATPSSLRTSSTPPARPASPRASQIPHRALVNFLWTMRERPGLEAEDVLVAVTTLSFDIAGLELYLPLVVGAPRRGRAARRPRRSARARRAARASGRDRHAGDADDLADAARLRLDGRAG